MPHKKTKTAERPSRRRQCELGANCPYRNEYQHASEYAHDNNAPKLPSFEGGGHKLGTGPHMPRQQKSRVANKPEKSSEVTACCDVCGTFVPLSSFDAHMRTHEGPVSQPVRHPATSLISEQDREYEAALEADILRLSRESYEAEVAQQQKCHVTNKTSIARGSTSEDEELRKALKLSLESSHTTATANPVIDLTDSPPVTKRRRTRHPSPGTSPEPTSGELVMLRFRVACDGKTSKLQRSFRLLSTLESVYAFVSSELKRNDLMVQPVIGMWNYTTEKARTLQDLGVTTNATLIVRSTT